MSEPDEAAITRLLAEHRSMRLGKLVDPRQWECWCGQELGPLGIDDMRLEEDHRAHVAAVLAAHMADGLERIAIDIETAAAINESMFPNAPDYRSGLRTAAQMVRLTPDTEGEK